MGAPQLVSHWLPCSVVFISTANGGKTDIMTATAMFISEEERLFAISVAKDHLTAQLIEQSGEFTLVMASESQKDLVWKLGSVRGESGNKLERFSVEALPDRPNKPQIPSGCSAWMDCQVVSRYDVADNYLIIGKVVEEQDLGNPPLVWQKDKLFSLKPL